LTSLREAEVLANIRSDKNAARARRLRREEAARAEEARKRREERAEGGI